MKIFNIKQIGIDVVFALLGIMSASIGLKCFLLPNNFLDGGATGLSLLLAKSFSIDFSILLVIVNLPFIFLAYKEISPAFSVRSITSIIVLAIVVHYIEFPVITNDKLLISVFGGLFLGAGIGFVIRGGTVIDGTEILAIFFNKKVNIKIATSILIFNILIFSTAALVINIETALFSVLTYIAASKAADYIINGIEEYLGITIISSQSDAVREMLTSELGCGVTVYKGKPGLKTSDSEIDIIHTVITRLEFNRLQNAVNRIDQQAFVVNYNVNDIKGGMVKRLGVHH